MRSHFLMKRFSVALIGLLGLSATGAAQEVTAEDLVPLGKEALTQTFSGVTMHGTYKRERAQSGTSHFTETFHEDGSTTYREGPILDKGQWTVRDNIICFAYIGELSGGQSCYNVFRAGNCYYSYSLGQLRDRFPLYPNRWSAKTIIEGEYTSCDDLVS